MLTTVAVGGLATGAACTGAAVGVLVNCIIFPFTFITVTHTLVLVISKNKAQDITLPNYFELVGIPQTWNSQNSNEPVVLTMKVDLSQKDRTIDFLLTVFSSKLSSNNNIVQVVSDAESSAYTLVEAERSSQSVDDI